MEHAAALRRASQNILGRSLGLREGQNLLVFADATSLEAADLVARFALECGIHCTILFVPAAAQADAPWADNLPLPTEAAVREADAVLSCLSDRPEQMHYRLKVLRTAWSRRTRLAHAPGLTLQNLRAADVDYALLAERSQLLALAIILGRRAEVITHDARGHEHRLDVEMGGWSYPPAINDGLIPAGAWANVPPGEVYVVPRGAEGSFVANGSAPGHVMAPGDEIILTFRHGRLADIGPAESSAMAHLYRTQIAYAQRHNDGNWTNLAELGIGLNPAVRQLTGVALVDEKMAQTVHLALCPSASLGGDVESVIHCDLVAALPTLRIGGRTVLAAGEWLLDETEWRPDPRRAVLPPGWWERVSQLQRSGARVERDNGRLLRAWTAGRGRWDSTQVGGEEATRRAARLYELLPAGGGALSRDDLVGQAARAGLEPRSLPGLVWLLRQYDLVRIPGERET